MPKKKKSLPATGRLRNNNRSSDKLNSFVLVDKQRLAQSLKDFQAGVKSKEQVEAVADVLFERLRRVNMRWK